MSTGTTTPEFTLRNFILARHRSVRAFCNMYNLPYSTIDNVFKRGIHSVSISTATQICGALGLDLSAFGKGMIAEQQEDKPTKPEHGEVVLLENYHSLDSFGKELVELVAAKEHERCASGQAFVPPSLDEDGWQQYLGKPIACRGGGVTTATEEDARQMERIYKGLLDGDGSNGGGSCE